jgi:hypothetical protein
MTAHHALQALRDVIAEETAHQAEIAGINAAIERHQAAVTDIDSGAAAANRGVARATQALSAALMAAGEGCDTSPAVAEARSDLQTALKEQAKATTKAAEAEARRQAIASLSERARPIAERLMQIDQVKSEAARRRLVEYGEELATAYRLAAAKLAELNAMGHALNRIAMAADVSDRFTVMDGGPSVLTLSGVGTAQRVVINFEADVPVHRAAYINRLQAEGFNLLGAS